MSSVSETAVHNDRIKFDVPAGLVHAMSNPDMYPHPVHRVDLRETHISKVFLAGDYVYKVKKPVSLGFLDFSTLDKRHYFCTLEVSLNRRLAPDVYIEVVPVTNVRGHYRLGGAGTIVEYAVKMRRLPETRSLRHLLRHKKIDSDAIERLAERLVAYYHKAPHSAAIHRFGTLESIRSNCEDNFHQIAALGGDHVDTGLLDITSSATSAFLDNRRELFTKRVSEGNIRDCHGDLRCGHIYDDDGIHIIDCIEFNERFRYSDIACDLAFLIMDIEYEGYPDVANRLVDHVCRLSGDLHLYELLDFYKCYRALVRSKVCYISQRETSGSDYLSKKFHRESNKYLLLAYHYAVRFTRPTLWIMCGLPASGKSTIARYLSDILGITVLRSDHIRKQLFGKQEGMPDIGPFENGIYSQGATALTYGRMLMLGQNHLEKGRSVILDATFSRSHYRLEALELARTMHTRVILIETRASGKCLDARLAKRNSKSSLSDARPQHLAHIQKSFEPLTDVSEDVHIVIDTTRSKNGNLQKILSHHYRMSS